MIFPEDFFSRRHQSNWLSWYHTASIKWDWVSKISNRCILQYWWFKDSGISRVNVEHVELAKPLCLFAILAFKQVLFWSWLPLVLNSGVNHVQPVHQLLRPLVARLCRHRLLQFLNIRQLHRTSTFFAQFSHPNLPSRQTDIANEIWGVGHHHCNLHRNKPYGNIKLNHHGLCWKKLLPYWPRKYLERFWMICIMFIQEC